MTKEKRSIAEACNQPLLTEDVVGNVPGTLIGSEVANGENTSQKGYDTLDAAAKTVEEREISRMIFGYAKRLFLSNDASIRSGKFYESFPNNMYIRTQDGVTIGAFHYKPKVIDEETLFVVVCHGKGTDRYEASVFGNLAELLEEYNVSFLVIDYRGFGDSGGEYSIHGANTDIQTALRYMIDTYPGRQIYLVGHSLGATAVIEYGRHAASNRLLEMPTQIYALAPFSSTLDICNDFKIFHFLSFFIPSLTSLISRFFEYDSVSAGKLISGRLKIIHGENDKIISIEHSEKIHKGTGCILKRTHHNHFSIFSDPDVWKDIFEEIKKERHKNILIPEQKNK